jgi:hypothetical protein
MINDNHILIATRVADQLKQANIVLEPRDGTPIGLLSSTFNGVSSQVGLQPNQYLEVIGGASRLIGRAQGAESLHDEKMEWTADLVLKGITKDLEVAKNIIKPTIARVFDELQGDMEKCFSDAAHGFELVQSDVPKILLNQKIENLFERYKVAPITNIKTLLVFPELTPAEIRRRINTGDDELNELIAEVADVNDLEILIESYKHYFTKDGFSDLSLTTDRGYEKTKTIAYLLMYFLTLGLENDLPDGVNGTVGVVVNHLKTLRGGLGAVIYRHIRSIERSIEDKELIQTVLGYGSERKIYVNRAVYDKFLDEGGSPEAVLAAVVSNQSFAYNSILDNKAKLEKIWETQLENIHSKNNVNKLTLMTSAIRKSISKIIDELEVIPEGAGTKGEMQKRLTRTTSNFYLTDLDRLPTSIKRIVFDTLYPEQTNARFIIDTLDAKEVEVGDDPEVYRRAAAEVTRQLIAQWLVKNVTVATVTNGW